MDDYKPVKYIKDFKVTSVAPLTKDLDTVYTALGKIFVLIQIFATLALRLFGADWSLRSVQIM